jgi:glutaredoxin
MHEVVLYHAPGCHLCEVARASLLELQREVSFELREIDIHSDPELEKKWLYEYPVIEVNGTVVTLGQISIARVRSVLTQ